MNKTDIFIIAVVLCALSVAIYGISVLNHDEQVRKDQLQDLWIEWMQDDDCEELQKQLDKWNEYINKPKRTVQWIEDRMIELECVK